MMHGLSLDLGSAMTNPLRAQDALSSRPPLAALLRERILVLDGAMGTMVQAQGLSEEDYRGALYTEHALPLKGNHDVLCQTKPEAIAQVHRAYFAAGADVVETCTFSANAISQADYGLELACRDINRAAAELALAEAAQFTAEDPSRPRYVAGSIGPTNRTLSMSASVEDPGARQTSFEELQQAYRDQVAGLLDGGVDCLLVETIFDTLNAKAAWCAIDKEFADRGSRVPVLLSGTITDAAGRTLSGQTVEAFWTSIEHSSPDAVGFNCALGPQEMRPHIESLAALADAPILCYPNAGLPNAFGDYDLGPEAMAEHAHALASEGLVNLVGGCCGTTPEHIQAIAQAVAGLTPRVVPAPRAEPAFSGLERLELRADSNFCNIGERTNVTGSRRFARLILNGDMATALEVAREQVENGAQMLDICMDEGMLDAVPAMREFLRLLAAEPDIARVPLVIDSSRFEVLMEGLKNVQGRAVVNSLSLKEGEEAFLEQARLVHRLGASVVIMAFDEEGQAVDVDRRVAIVERARRLLHQVGFADRHIIFDLNVLAIATGMEEHNDYARAFLEALGVLKKRFPECSYSGGISNLSFSFRGADEVREAMHAVFLQYAIPAGLNMGIVNAGKMPLVDDLPEQLRNWCEDLIFHRRPEAAEDLLQWAEARRLEKEAQGGEGVVAPTQEAWRDEPCGKRLAHALIHGLPTFLEVDLAEALQDYPDPLSIIEGPLMDGMNVVGERFGSGRMFLPQVVKSARVMKKAVAYLQPYLDAAKQEVRGGGRGKVLMATVKGDVHDIGKNIVGVILACNGFEIIDLGVMVPAKTILESAKENDVQLIGLSGLITPSLDEMNHVASELERESFHLPLLIGGATTSAAHTALKIAPEYSGPTVHVLDASRAVHVASSLVTGEKRTGFLQENEQKQHDLREKHQKRDRAPLLPFAEAASHATTLDYAERLIVPPAHLGVQVQREVPLADLRSRIDWSPFFAAWELHGRYPAILEDELVGEQARLLHHDAETLLDRLCTDQSLRAAAVFGLFPTASEGNDLVVDCSTEAERLGQSTWRLPMLRQQRKGRSGQENRSLADYIAPTESAVCDHLGMFVVTAGLGLEALVQQAEQDHDDYQAILLKAVADRLAEAYAEHLHEEVRRVHWAYAPEEHLANDELIRERYRGIRPAPGYPACPDHSLKYDIFALLDAQAQIGVSLTESRAMLPTASVSGFFFAHPAATYFGVGKIGEDQVQDYAERRGISTAEATRLLQASIVV